MRLLASCRHAAASGGQPILTYSTYFQAETRAEFSERSVQKLQKEVDRLEGRRLHERVLLREGVNAKGEEMERGGGGEGHNGRVSVLELVGRRGSLLAARVPSKAFPRG